jgi:prophage DNA circulation protein
MASWPSSLPQTPLLDGYSDVPQNSVLRSDFDTYTKQRNRFTAVIHDVSEKYVMTNNQYTTFIEFYENTLNFGADVFTKTDPVTGLTKNYRFVEPYSSSFNGVLWVVELTLEKLP